MQKPPKTKPHSIYFVTFTVALLLGCSSAMGFQKNFIDDAKRYIERSEWEMAYRTLEDALGSTESRLRLLAYDLISTNPKIKLAADETFSKNSLLKTFVAFGPSTAYQIESVRLNWYAKFASASELLAAQENLEAVKATTNIQKISSVAEIRRSGSEILIVEAAVFTRLLAQDQVKFKTMYPALQVIPSDSVGIIKSHQIVDRSIPGSGVGSQLGSTFAQAAYIDKSFSNSNYSAVGQIGAGLLGGLLGSVLNTSPETRFLINYSVEFGDGSVRGVLKSSSDGISAPTGQCVFTIDMLEAPRYLCGDSLAAFIDRATRVASVFDQRATTSALEKVNCQIQSVGVIKLNLDDCQKSNGVVVP